MTTLAGDDPRVIFKNGKAYVQADNQEEATLFKGCLYLPDSFLTEQQKEALALLTSDETKERYRCCWYLATTLTALENKTFGDFKEPGQKSVYLHLLMDKCLKGKRPCYEIPRSNLPEVSATDLAAAMQAVQTKRRDKYGANGGLIRDAVEQTESMFSRNTRLGLIQGQEDPWALVGLPMPSKEVIQQIQAMTGNCYKCGDRDHLQNQCPCPTPVCYRCKRPGHIKIDCQVYVQQQSRGSKRGGRPSRVAARNQADRGTTDNIQQLTVPGAAEAVWTPFSHLAGFSQRQPVTRDSLVAPKHVPHLQQLQLPHSDTLSCTGRLQHPVTRQKHEVNILVDSGNSVHSCAVISLKCAQKLALPITLHRTTIGTADSSKPMVSSGKIQQLDLLLPNQSIPVILQNVTVLPKLNGDINLGANFLKTHQGTLTWITGNPVLQLQRADLQATTPILLQMSPLTAPRSAPVTRALGAELTSQIKTTINQDFLVETNTGRRIRLKVQGPPGDASISSPLQTLDGVETAEGIYRTAKRSNGPCSEILFINTAHEDRWVRTKNTLVELFTYDDRGVSYPHKRKDGEVRWCVDFSE